MEKILVSACLLGEKTRYDGKDNLFPFLQELGKHYELIPFCPEVASGLGIPRPKAEIRGGGVVSIEGKDLTREYVEASEEAARLCRFMGISLAILKDGSPACGVRLIHDGSFSNTKKEGQGITARKLSSMGIKVYCEDDNLSFLLPPSQEEKARQKALSIKKKEQRDAQRAKAKQNKEKDQESSNKSHPKKTSYGKRKDAKSPSRQGKSPKYGGKGGSPRPQNPRFSDKKRHHSPQNRGKWASSKSKNKVTKK